MFKALIASLPFVLGPTVASLGQTPAPDAAPSVARQAAGPARPARPALIAALHMSELVAVMHDEGLDYGKQLENDLFPGAGGRRWDATVETIYDPGRMEARIARDLAGRIDARQLGPVLAFLTSDLGRRVVGDEIAARRAMLDQEVKDAMRAEVGRMAAGRDPRLVAVRRFAAENALIDSNVAGAMNANYAFYLGLKQGGAPGFDLPRERILRDVARQEDDIRAETVAWLVPFLVRAYKPLSDAEFARYEAFTRSAAGRALNQALFATFDGLFGDISRRLGLAAAQVLSGQDL